MRTALSVCLLLVGPVTQGQAQAPSGQRPAALVRAGDLLRAGNFEEAETAYTLILADSARLDRRFRAEAHFGRGFAVQQGLLGVDSVAPQRLIDAVQDYLSAAELDSSSQFGPAYNNAGLLFRRAGNHEDAARSFLKAAATRHAARPYFYLNAGQEFQALGRTERAAWAYRQALAADSTYAEARQALLDLFLNAGWGDSVVAQAGRAARLGSAVQYQDALLTTLGTPSIQLSPAGADSGMVLLARYYAANNPGPRLFASLHRSRLRRVAAAHPDLTSAVEGMNRVYQRPAEGRPLPQPPSGSWWRGSRSRLAAWSSLMRSQGDWYNRAGEPALAEAYYEAAIGWPDRRMMEPWVDPDALLPLAVLYARHPAGGADKSERYLRDIEQYEEMLFSAKMRAYQADDVRRIRSLHMTLGALYAERNQWGPGVRSGIFQLEHMSEASRRLARETGQPVEDPPELMEKLVSGYLATGRRAKADSLARVVKSQYSRQKRLEDAARVDRILRPS